MVYPRFAPPAIQPRPSKSLPCPAWAGGGMHLGRAPPSPPVGLSLPSSLQGVLEVLREGLLLRGRGHRPQEAVPVDAERREHRGYRSAD